MGRSSEKNHPIKDPEYRAKVPLELIHTDIAGPFQPVAIEGRGKYNLVIVDDYSRKSWCIPLKKKSDTAAAMGSFWDVCASASAGIAICSSTTTA